MANHLGKFGTTDGVSIKSSSLKHTGSICCHYVKGTKKGKINAHGGGRKSGKSTGKESHESY